MQAELRFLRKKVSKLEATIDFIQAEFQNKMVEVMERFFDHRADQIAKHKRALQLEEDICLDLLSCCSPTERRTKQRRGLYQSGKPERRLKERRNANIKENLRAEDGSDTEYEMHEEVYNESEIEDFDKSVNRLKRRRRQSSSGVTKQNPFGKEDKEGTTNYPIDGTPEFDDNEKVNTLVKSEVDSRPSDLDDSSDYFEKSENVANKKPRYIRKVAVRRHKFSSRTGDQELVPFAHSENLDDQAKAKVAKVWGYFQQASDKSHAVCNICSKVIKTKSGNTTGLHSHIRLIHNLQSEKKFKEPRTLTNRITSMNVSAQNAMSSNNITTTTTSTVISSQTHNLNQDKPANKE